MGEAGVAVFLGLILTGMIIFVLWTAIRDSKDDDDDDKKPPYGGGGGGFDSTQHAIRTATIGGGLGGV